MTIAGAVQIDRIVAENLRKFGFDSDLAASVSLDEAVRTIRKQIEFPRTRDFQTYVSPDALLINGNTELSHTTPYTGSNLNIPPQSSLAITSSVDRYSLEAHLVILSPQYDPSVMSPLAEIKLDEHIIYGVRKGEPSEASCPGGGLIVIVCIPEVLLTETPQTPEKYGLEFIHGTPLLYVPRMSVER